MFVGHLAVALAAKTRAPRLPLGWLVAAAFGLDLVWPVFLLIGIEHVGIDPGNTAFTPLDFTHYPWSHSLLTALAWAAAAGWLAASNAKSAQAGLLVGAVVVSHWVLDFVTHAPDLPLFPGGPRLGLGLWNSLPGTFVIEGGLFVTAVVAYVRTFGAKDSTGRWAFFALVGMTALIWASGPFSPSPPSEMAIAIVGLAMWLFPPWAAWIDRHRSAQVRS